MSVAELMGSVEEDEDAEEDRPAVPVTQRSRNDGQIVKIGGILSGVTRKVTKKGDAWAAVTLEDLGGAIEVLRTHPGTTEVYLRLRANQKTTVVRLDDKLRVTASPALQANLKQLLGPSCIAS